MEMVKNWVKNFWEDEEGLGTLEILLICAVLIGVAILFREQIMGWVETLLENIQSDVDGFTD